MDSTQIMDESILRVLQAHDGAFGLSSDAIVIGLRSYGFSSTSDVVEGRLRYLSDPEVGFVRRAEAEGQYHAHLKFWRLTARGQNHLGER
jgi:repressor of nif and glnA expression